MNLMCLISKNNKKLVISDPYTSVRNEYEYVETLKKHYVTKKHV